MDARELRRPQWLVASCGVWQVGLGFYFMLVRPALLPEDTRYIGADPGALAAAAPGLALWLGKVFLVMGGFMAGAGVLTAYLALRVLPSRPGATTGVLALTGVLTVGLMSAVNFALHSDFRWLLFVPVATWATGLAWHAWATSRNHDVDQAPGRGRG